ncbi:hypothetical protein VTO73DRAFT_2130 [Trametes versicolor]
MVEDRSSNSASRLGLEAWTAADRVLSTPELLPLIFMSLRACGWTAVHRERAALVACARVCRQFSTHALDVLWTTIYDLRDLFKILPSFQSLHGKWWLVAADIPHAEWANFRTYTRRIRYLVIDSGDGIKPVESLVWTILARNCRGEPLLPNLRSLNLHLSETCDMDQELSRIVPLLSPRLHTVRIRFTYHFHSGAGAETATAVVHTAAKILFKAIVQTAPHLTTLDWDGPIDTEALHEIDHLPRLEVLKLSCSSKDASDVQLKATTTDLPLLRAISTIRSLRTLRLEIRLPPSQLRSTGFDFGSAFQELQTLKLVGTLRDASHFVHRMQPSVLTELCLDLISWDPDLSYVISGPSSPLSELCAALPLSLRVFSLSVLVDPPSAGELPEARGAPRAWSETLVPLLRFKHLRVVWFDPNSPAVHITDQFLSTLATTAPNLESLHIAPGSDACTLPGQDPPGAAAADVYPTIQSLVTLARNCPSLVDLTLPYLDISSVSTPTDKSVPFMEHPLSSIAISRIIGGVSGTDGRWPEPLHFMLLLDRLFPKLLGRDFSIRLGFRGDDSEEAKKFLSEIRIALAAMREKSRNDRLRQKRALRAAGKGGSGLDPSMASTSN